MSGQNEASLMFWNCVLESGSGPGRACETIGPELANATEVTGFSGRPLLPSRQLETEINHHKALLIGTVEFKLKNWRNLTQADRQRLLSTDRTVPEFRRLAIRLPRCLQTHSKSRTEALNWPIRWSIGDLFNDAAIINYDLFFQRLIFANSKAPRECICCASVTLVGELWNQNYES